MIENQKVYSLGPTKTNKCLRLRSAFFFAIWGHGVYCQHAHVVMGTHKVLGTVGLPFPQLVCCYGRRGLKCIILHIVILSFSFPPTCKSHSNIYLPYFALTVLFFVPIYRTQTKILWLKYLSIHGCRRMQNCLSLCWEEGVGDKANSCISLC